MRPAREERLRLQLEERPVTQRSTKTIFERRRAQMRAGQIPLAARVAAASRRFKHQAPVECSPSQSLLDLLDGSGECGYIAAVEAVEEFLYRQELRANG